MAETPAENGKATAREGTADNSFCVSLARTGECKRFQCDFNQMAEVLANSRITWINYSVDDIRGKGEDIATSLGFTRGIVTKLLESHYSEYEDRDNELGLMVPAVTVKNLEVTVNSLIILMRKGLILTMAGGRVNRLVRFSRYADVFFRKIPKSASTQDALTLALIRILDENNDVNFDHLREIESQADELSKDLLDPKQSMDRVGPTIYNTKHALITYMNVLWSTLDVINSLRYGDAEVLTDNRKILDRITVLSADLTTQLELSEHMSEVLASGLEVLQTIYNNQLQMLNNRLAFLATWLAIGGTAVLVPNTLATIYGIGVVSEHLSYEFIVDSLFLSVFLSAALVLVMIKWKDWMPRSKMVN